MRFPEPAEAIEPRVDIAFLVGDRRRREPRERALATADGLDARRFVAVALG